MLVTVFKCVVIALITIIVGIALALYLIVNIFQLIDLADNIVKGQNQNKKNEFLKILIKISIIFVIGIYIEIKYKHFPSWISYLAFFVWANILIMAPFIIFDKYKKKIQKIIVSFKKK